MSLLDELRASLAPQQPQEAPSEPSRPCPFTFGPWTPHSGPQAAPGEAQRPVLLNGTLVAWQRRVLARWVPLEGEPIGLDLQLHHLISPDGGSTLVSLHADALLKELAQRLGA